MTNGNNTNRFQTLASESTNKLFCCFFLFQITIDGNFFYNSRQDQYDSSSTSGCSKCINNASIELNQNECTACVN